MLARVLGAVAAVAAVAIPAAAQISDLTRFEGQYDYVVTGTTLRTNSNGSDACAAGTSGTATVSGIPSGATITAAYLYWAGSGTADNTVTFAGSSRTADRTANDTYVFNGNTFNFFGAFENVTSLVTGNGNYTLSGLAVNEGSFYCTSQAVMSGFTLVVIYQSASLPIKRIEVRDGMLALRQGTYALSLGNFLSSPSPDARLTYAVYEGDPDQTGSGADPEQITFNGSTLTDASNPANNPYNSTVNSQSRTNVYGYDLDTYSASSLLAGGSRSATLNVTSGTDLVLLQTVVTSIAIVMVDVTPKGLAQPVARLPGTQYAQAFTVENTSIATGAFDLIASRAGAPQAFLTIDSVTGPGITTRTRQDSARVTLAANTSTVYTVWYTVPNGGAAQDATRLLARSVSYPTRAEAQSQGFAEVRRTRPQLTITKSVTPNTTTSPGTQLTYSMTVLNAGDYEAQTVIVRDSLPPAVDLKVGSPAQTLPAGITATVEYSLNGTAWTYVPVSGGCGASAGFDRCARHVRWRLTGNLQPGAPASTGTYTFVARIR
jgi:uncharacterized repeat protein (TIGR01451 family)